MGYDNPLQNEYEGFRQRAARIEGNWCDDCHGYTHMPYCPSYRAVDEISDSGATQQRAIAYLVLNGVVNAGQYWPDEIVEWARRLMTGEQHRGVELVRMAITDHNQHQQCAAQLRFLGNRAEELSSLLAGMTTERDGLREALEKLNSTLIGLQAHPHIYERTVIDRYLHFMVTEIDAALNHAEREEG